MCQLDCCHQLFINTNVCRDQQNMIKYMKEINKDLYFSQCASVKKGEMKSNRVDLNISGKKKI